MYVEGFNNDEEMLSIYRRIAIKYNLEIGEVRDLYMYYWRYHVRVRIDDCEFFKVVLMGLGVFRYNSKKVSNCVSLIERESNSEFYRKMSRVYSAYLVYNLKYNKKM